MKNDGYTLLELILVIGIIGVMSGIAIFRFGMLEEYRGKQELKKFIHVIDSTKNNAVVHHFRSSIEIFPDGYFVNWKERKWRERFSSSISLAKKNMNVISFNESGKIAGEDFSQNSAGRIVFQIGDHYYTVTVSPVTGKVNCYKGIHNEKEKGIPVN